MILTVDEFRAHVATATDDDALRRLLDAAEALIVGAAGPPGQDVVETVDGWTPRIVLSRPAAALVAVREVGFDTDLTTSDYTLESPYVIRRESFGRWGMRVRVTYTPAADAALRAAAQTQIVEAFINYRPALQQTTAGNWNEMQVQDFPAEVHRALELLAPARGMTVV